MVAGFVEVNPEGDKISRAVAASAQMESGHWYLPQPKLAPWVDGFITLDGMSRSPLFGGQPVNPPNRVRQKSPKPSETLS